MFHDFNWLAPWVLQLRGREGGWGAASSPVPPAPRASLPASVPPTMLSSASLGLLWSSPSSLYPQLLTSHSDATRWGPTGPGTASLSLGNAYPSVLGPLPTSVLLCSVFFSRVEAAGAGRLACPDSPSSGLVLVPGHWLCGSSKEEAGQRFCTPGPRSAPTPLWPHVPSGICYHGKNALGQAADQPDQLTLRCLSRMADP